MDTPRPSARSAPTSSPPPTPATPNGSSASTPNQPPYPRPRGSTSHPTRTRNRPQRISEQPASKILTRAAPPSNPGNCRYRNDPSPAAAPNRQEDPMGIIAWIVLGAVAGFIAEHLTGRKT